MDDFTPILDVVKAEVREGPMRDMAEFFTFHVSTCRDCNGKYRDVVAHVERVFGDLQGVR